MSYLPIEDYGIIGDLHTVLVGKNGSIDRCCGYSQRPGCRRVLSDGISPSHGMDTKGPSVTLTSIARATCHSYKTHREDLINMKIAPSMVAGAAGTRRLMQLFRVWCEQKHSHIQFNVLDRQSLLDAQKNPELYRDLVVRIAG